MTIVHACACGKEYEQQSSFDDTLPGPVHECVICGEFGCESCLTFFPRSSHDWVHKSHTEAEIHDFEIAHEG